MKNTLRKAVTFATAIACTIGAFVTPMTAMAQDTTKNYYSLSANGGTFDGTHYVLNDEIIKNVFFFDGSYTYYLQADGTPMKDRLTYHPDGEHIIYFDTNGHEVFTNFQYCPSVGYTCYFGSDGYIYKDQITFVGDKTYYMDGDGRMKQSGWFQFANGRDYGYANGDGTLINNGWGRDPYGRVVFYHWNGMVARGLITDGAYYYSMDETDGHYLGQWVCDNSAPTGSANTNPSYNSGTTNADTNDVVETQDPIPNPEYNQTGGNNSNSGVTAPDDVWKDVINNHDPKNDVTFDVTDW